MSGGNQTNHSLKNKKVFVGLSGGVDSSVSAALLKDAGADVTGVFIRVWQPDFIECTWKEDREDAMRVCAHLEIPFREYNFEKEYKENVVDYMVREYKAGRTPNPDVMCNKYVKFDAFMNKALSDGADYIATGHYARVEHSESSAKLFAGRDQNKDQSYFLWTLTSKVLERVLFPVGDIEKSETRRLAEKCGLPTAAKKDSQGLCFVGHVDMPEFLSHFAELERGDVLNEKGEAIGFHEGAIVFTIGQRHGFTVAKKTPNDEPYFVVSKDALNNTITVAEAPRAEEALREAKEFVLEDTNWLVSIEEGKEYRARVRYRGELYPCTILRSDLKTKISFTEAPVAPSAGQSAVIYDREPDSPAGGQVVGGGILGHIRL